ncbi:hypothetical protein V1227_18720 [Lentzea sp. DG1S-22]|uniref:hypothetical protein n=1 Tax=Lentzea sp. DG1S-22 TaxID=3108822 RepID=UPI002E76DC1C|nr:hypothetical protein [Lentzea sp. DG1S-22]WVH84689.1 hypothetical protein V1227_18720 [Lentzea sp. DG1S-22]
MILCCKGCRAAWLSPGIDEDGWFEAIRCTCPVGAEPEFEDLSNYVVGALQRHAAALYEACEPSLSPWPDDPDGSTLRFAGVIRDLLDWVADMAATPFGSTFVGQALSLELHLVIARSLELLDPQPVSPVPSTKDGSAQ